VASSSRKQKELSFLESVDSVLVGRGFHRPRGSQEWSVHDGKDRLWAHLNFGLSAVQLTVGVEYVDVRKASHDLPGAVFSSSESPQRDWSTDDAPERVADYVSEVVEARLPLLSDRCAVVARLLEREVRSWPVFSFSHRIRLLPVLLVNLGRGEEALKFCRYIRGQSLSLDQIRPPFTEFCQTLESKLAD